jgi:hypothetical protein
MKMVEEGEYEQCDVVDNAILNNREVCEKDGGG